MNHGLNWLPTILGVAMQIISVWTRLVWTLTKESARKGKCEDQHSRETRPWEKGCWRTRRRTKRSQEY